MRLNLSSLVLRVYAVMACISVGLGAVFLWGGEERFSGDAFATPRRLVSWMSVAPSTVWGGAFLIFGVVMALCIGKQLAVWVLRVGVALYLLLSLSFLWSVMDSAQVAASGCVVYAGIALVHLFLSDHLTHRGWEG